jgi:hypothetical protein
MRTLLQIRSEILRLKWHVAATRFQYAMRKHAIALKAGFDPDQPRDELGQWTDAGDDDEDDTDNEGSAGSQLIDELSSAERPKGHHFVPRSIYRDLPLSPERARCWIALRPDPSSPARMVGARNTTCTTRRFANISRGL